MQFLDVLFQILMVWSSEVEIYRIHSVVSELRWTRRQAHTIHGIS